MKETRERALLAHVPTLATLEEINAFRAAIRDGGETMGAELYRALMAQTDRVRR